MKKQDFLVKRLIPALGQDMYKINLECLVIPECKEALIYYFDCVKRTQKATGRSSHWLKIGDLSISRNNN